MRVSSMLRFFLAVASPCVRAERRQRDDVLERLADEQSDRHNQAEQNYGRLMVRVTG